MSRRVVSRWEAPNTPSPPSPPSPPSGPPRGTNISRRKLQLPLPPRPAFTVMETSSTNIETTLSMRRPSYRRKDGGRHGAKRSGHGSILIPADDCVVTQEKGKRGGYEAAGTG